MWAYPDTRQPLRFSFYRFNDFENSLKIFSFYFSFADSSSSLCVLVSTVGKLCRLINEDVNEKIMQVLGPEDLQRYYFKKVAKYCPECLEW